MNSEVGQDITSSTYEIPEIKLHGAKKNLDRIVRRAAKIGVEACSYSVGETFEIPFERFADEGGFRSRRFSGTSEELKTLEDGGKITYCRFVEITVSGPKPILKGWEFAATLQHLSDDQGQAINILRVSPDFGGKLPERFKHSTAGSCDHCHQIRNRRDTYVVHHKDSGDWKQIGSSCLKDFTGGNDPRQMLAALEFFLDAEKVLSENFDEESGGSNRVCWSLREFLATTAAVIRENGWMSKRAAGDTGKTATAVLVEMAMRNK
jgi:hypothetical protein